MRELAALPEHLRGCGDVGALFARGAVLSRQRLGFGRALIVSLADGLLTARSTDPLPDGPSDRLRLQLLESPVPLRPGSPEGAVVARSAPSRARSPIAEQLGLEHYGYAPIAPDGRTLALLVVDRRHPRLSDMDRAAIDICGAVIGVALEQVVLRARIGELDAELRYLTVSAHALMGEISRAPIALPGARGERPAFPLLHAVDAPSSGVHELLSDREVTVASLLAEGMSNREIAERLVLSPETVKGHVARILRKLDATNRVAAVTRFTRLQANASEAAPD